MEEEIHVRTRLTIVVVLALALAALLAAPATASADRACKAGPLISKAELTFVMTDPDTGDGYWDGSITGCVRGTMQMTGLVCDYSPAPIFTFTEGFTITTRCGLIEGYVIGIMPDMGFSSCGWVTNATGRWSRMVEWMVYQSGEVTESEGTYVARSHVVFMPAFSVR
jgi:hypothetical protein